LFLTVQRTQLQPTLAKPIGAIATQQLVKPELNAANFNTIKGPSLITKKTHANPTPNTVMCVERVSQFSAMRKLHSWNVIR